MEIVIDRKQWGWEGLLNVLIVFGVFSLMFITWFCYELIKDSIAGNISALTEIVGLFVFLLSFIVIGILLIVVLLMKLNYRIGKLVKKNQ